KYPKRGTLLPGPPSYSHPRRTNRVARGPLAPLHVAAGGVFVVTFKRVLALMVVLAALSARSEASTIAVSFVSENSGFADGAARMLGWQFTVNATPISIAAL